ncbi:hypothetical protein NDU88_004142 [Pleurodeles waltl]|uniref:Uncharacterized protein n=1 Tax=Pleurodeles waltl TaxID=8319 RepID=A0AAV7L0H9_PLEWA|nr:hypothetical protein NDU88_004142 [Pleurodeles waltl]
MSRCSVFQGTPAVVEKSFQWRRGSKGSSVGYARSGEFGRRSGEIGRLILSVSSLSRTFPGTSIPARATAQAHAASQGSLACLHERVYLHLTLERLHERA